MEPCKEVQAEEYVVLVEEATNFYTSLRFSLLASTWIPRPMGVCLWSGLHIILVLYEALMLLVLFPIVLVLAVLTDALIVSTFIYGVLILPIAIISFFLLMGICIALVWLWLVITCQCCTMPGRAPGQTLGQYVCTAGGTHFTNLLQDPPPAPVVEGGAAAAAAGPCAFLRNSIRNSITLAFVNHVALVSFPYWRVKLGDLRREIVPWYDTIAI